MSTPMTNKGFENLMNELNGLEKRAIELAKRVEIAREKGDLRENAEYHAAREDLALCNSRIQDIQSRVGSATIIDPAKFAGSNTVVFGATVKVYNLDDKEEEVFTLVGDGEADMYANKILTTSPLGQALLTRKVGDKVDVPVPKGKLRLKILEITFES